MLHRRAGQLPANGKLQRFAFGAVIVENAHLDEFVGAQGAVDFVQYRRRQPVLADHDYGVKRMRLRAQGTAFGGGQCQHAASVPELAKGNFGKLREIAENR